MAGPARPARLLLAALLTTAPALAWAPVASAQSGVEVTAQAEPGQSGKLLVAEPFRFVVRVTCPAGTRVEAPDLKPALGSSFALARALPPERKSEGDDTQHTFAYELLPLAEGEQTLKGLTVSCRARGASAAEAVPVPPVQVKVELQPSQEVAPLFATPFGPPHWLGAALVALLCVGLLALLLWRVQVARARRVPRVRGEPQVIVAAHERALRELGRLAEVDVATPEGLREYHERLSAILREYLEARFEVPAMEQTTWMIARDLRRLGVQAAWREGFVEVLRSCDLVKYARDSRDAQRARADLDRAAELVRASGTRLPEAAPVAVGEEVSRG